MVKIVSWLLLTLISSAGLATYFLQQQYEEKSADFRILYREITVKLSQHDAIIPLLPENQDAQEVQKILPQIVRWRQHTNLEPRRPIVLEGRGRYWLNFAQLSLLIDLKTLLNTLPETKPFKHLTLRWNNEPLFEQGEAGSHYWRWDKTISSPSQPFVLAVGDDPHWAVLPWLTILAPAPCWALLLYLMSQYQINKRRRDIADLRAHYSELTRLNTMGELAAGIVHELNQPLTAILSYNQTAIRLMKQDQGSQVPALLDAAVVQIKRIDTLLRQFRQRLDSEQTDYQPVDLRSLWSRIITLLDNELHSQKVRVSSHIPDNLPPLFAPPLWIEQILHNIVSNAIQAQCENAPGSAWITLHATSDDVGMTLTLADGGPGLTSQALQQVFMPFFTTRAHGIGLGMALADTLVQRLNGKIEVANVAGQGARFTLWFPLTTQVE